MLLTARFNTLIIVCIISFVVQQKARAADDSVSRGTTHESQVDSPHLVGYWLNWKMKKLSPVIACRINNHLILDFLQKNIGTYVVYCVVVITVKFKVT
jgi:hypothetical protein